jgi:hypothetical protein
MKRLLTPLSAGVDATRHLIWYLSYQITGETREATRNSEGLVSPAERA